MKLNALGSDDLFIVIGWALVYSQIQHNTVHDHITLKKLKLLAAEIFSFSGDLFFCS